MATELLTASVTALRRVLATALCATACLAQAQVTHSADTVSWFDGQNWVASTPQQGVAQAAGGVVVMSAPSHAAALQAALSRLGLVPRPLPVAGAYQLDTPPGAAALAMTRQLVEVPAQVGAPVQIAPNWSTPVRLR